MYFYEKLRNIFNVGRDERKNEKSDFPTVAEIDKSFKERSDDIAANGIRVSHGFARKGLATLKLKRELDRRDSGRPVVRP